MFDKIKKWNFDRKLNKDMKTTMLIAFSDYLAATTEAKRAETKAYESMTLFADHFNVEDLQNMLTNVEKIANVPQLQTDYFKQVSEQSHMQKMEELKLVK